MGLLSQGKPLSWDETRRYSKFVQERGVAQFMNIYNESIDRADGPFKWGDEVEYMLIKYDHRNKIVRLSLKAEEIFHKLDEQKSSSSPYKSLWNPEFGAFMVEGTPGMPYGIDGLLLSGLCEIEDSMTYRRHEVQRVLEPDESVVSITNFPRLGCPDFTYPICYPKPETSCSGSIFVPDEAIFAGHPRFKTLHKNIIARRGRKLAFSYPIYRDINTPDPFIEYFNDEETQKAFKPNQIIMDSMAFGMGCCCLQVTFQATHIEEAKVLYDQLAPLAPIGLALSAASPIYRGFLTDRDCRWAAVSSSVDDRTPEESGECELTKESSVRIPKSRYDSISLYLSRQGQKYNDLPLVMNQDFYAVMVANKVDPAVARHIAHLFVRDPISIYKEKLEQSDDELDHFENIQSTNWQTVRFKPPPSVHSPIGWRVEYRPLEAQTTDFENAAYVVFITLLTRVILAYKLNFLLPLSLVDENMIEAQKRDAIRTSKFWFRRDIMHKSTSKGPLSTVFENCTNSTNTCDQQRNNFRSTSNYNNNSNSNGNINNGSSGHRQRVVGNKVNSDNGAGYDAKKMTIDEIINGCGTFIGLMPIIRHYVESFDDGSNKQLISKINRYLKLISDRASLELKTTARFMRDFVSSHPKYAHDSVITDEINYDLISFMDKIGKGEVSCPELTGILAQQTTPPKDTQSILNSSSYPQRSL